MVWNGSTGVGLPTFVGVNELTQGWFGAGALLFIWLIVYNFSRNEPTREAAFAASFVTFIVGVLLRTIGIVDDKYLGVAIILLIATGAMLVARD